MRIDWTIMLSVISALTALAAVLLTPLLTVYSVKRQFAAQVLSAHRQAWINQLRDEIADLISLANTITLDRATGRLDPVRYAEQSHEMYTHWARINLLANQRETDHQELLGIIDDMLEKVCRGDVDAKQSRARIDALVSKAQAVLKREWERVKSGE